MRKKYKPVRYKDQCAFGVPLHWWIEQCSRKRGHGPRRMYCRQHAQIMEQRQVSQTVTTIGIGAAVAHARR